VRRFRFLASTLTLCGLACAQNYGTNPKPKPADYPAQARVGDLVIAAEYLLHALPAARQSFTVPEYLVIEIAAYPPRSKTVELASGMFTLRINGKKEELHTQAPGMVAASLKYSDWENRPSLEAAAGPIIFGRRDPVERFPGDQRDPDSQRPRRPQAPDTTPGGVERQQPETAAEVAVAMAFPDGPTGGPVSGYLYFAFKKKPASIKSLELIYHHGEEQTPIQLF
jgi:hypothetical protein